MKPKQLVYVRYYSATWIAKAKGKPMQVSCTGGEDLALQAFARKFYGDSEPAFERAEEHDTVRAKAYSMVF